MRGDELAVAPEGAAAGSFACWESQRDMGGR